MNRILFILLLCCSLDAVAQSSIITTSTHTINAASIYFRQLPSSSSSTDSVLVVNGGRVYMRAQSAISGTGGSGGYTGGTATTNALFWDGTTYSPRNITESDVTNLSTDLAAKMDKSLALNNQAASYTLALSDAGVLVRQNVASANTLTVPPNTSVAFPVGTQIIVSNTGAGQVTFAPGTGVTINSAGGALKLRVQYSVATLIKTGTDTWLLSGDISN